MGKGWGMERGGGERRKEKEERRAEKRRNGRKKEEQNQEISCIDKKFILYFSVNLNVHHDISRPPCVIITKPNRGGLPIFWQQLCVTLKDINIAL